MSRLLSAAVLTTLAVLLAVPASAAPTLNRADAAAGWLARQMTDGQRFEVVFDGVAFPDQGLTIDAVFAFAATKTGRTYSAAATAWLAQPDILAGYIGDGGAEAYAGATAKLALLAEVTGGRPTAFGGVNLVTRLRGLRAPSGRFTDRSAFGDFSNAFSQSLAIIALARTSGRVPATAISFLAASRCPDGGYPVVFGEATCASDIDATAVVIQALLAAGNHPRAQQGLTWLVGQQQAGGGYANSGVINANSTGLAGQALQTGGRLLAAARARAFLRTLQLTCAAPLADRGAIAYTADGFDPSTAPRATAQAILGLAGVGYAHLSAAGSTTSAPTLACP